MSISFPDERDFVETYEKHGERLTRLFSEQALEALGPLKELRLVDVAAGTGGAAVSAAARGALVLASDGNPMMIQRVSSRLNGFPGSAAQVDDFTCLDIADGRFDVATTFFGVLTSRHWDAGLAELVRITRPSGRIAATIWTHQGDCSPAHLLKRVFETTFAGRQLWTPEAVPAFSREALAEAMEEAGLCDPHVTELSSDWTPIDSARVVEECAPMFSSFPAVASLSQEDRARLDTGLGMAFDQLRDRDGVVRLRTRAYFAIGSVPHTK